MGTKVQCQKCNVFMGTKALHFEFQSTENIMVDLKNIIKGAYLTFCEGHCRYTFGVLEPWHVTHRFIRMHYILHLV